MFELVAELPGWVQVVLTLLLVATPLATAWWGRAAKRQETKATSVTAHDQLEAGEENNLRQQLLDWNNQLQTQLNAQAGRLKQLEDHQRALEKKVQQLQRENHTLRLWARALVRQVEAAGVNPIPFEDFEPS